MLLLMKNSFHTSTSIVYKSMYYVSGTFYKMPCQTPNKKPGRNYKIHIADIGVRESKNWEKQDESFIHKS